MYAIDVPSAPYNFYSTSFTKHTIKLSWFPPLNNSQCIKHYIVNSTVPISPINVTTNNITITTTSSEPFDVSIAGVDYAGRIGPFSEQMCIKVSGMIISI